MSLQMSTKVNVQCVFLLKRIHSLHQIFKGDGNPERLGTRREE